jgi:FMN phosphatase YigB (HAD superfamily)
MLAALRSGVNLMVASDDPSRTLREVFDADFYPRLGVQAGELQGPIQSFYDKVFPTLIGQTRPKAGASELVDWAVGAGCRLAIASDPLFPLQATKERIRWAGLDPACFEVISSFESFHFSKSHPAYFAEMLGRLGWPEGPVIMAGDDTARDLVPARELGLSTYHVDGGLVEARGRSTVEAPGWMDAPHGDLVDLRAWLQSASLEPYTASFKTRAAVLAVLEATPGALQGLVACLSPEMWKHEISPDDWAMIELVCHLRDTEREVHGPQIQALIEATTPFIARPDAAVWAKQRRYLSEDGPSAIRDFAAARVLNLELLKSASGEAWKKPARHAIFGPTNFLEAIGFMADHDRMHVKQAWTTLQQLRATAHRN